MCLQIIHSRSISQSLLVSDISNKRGKIGSTDCPETSVNNNKHKLRNNTGEWGRHSLNTKATNFRKEDSENILVFCYMDSFE
jgi:hypothetical protein